MTNDSSGDKVKLMYWAHLNNSNGTKQSCREHCVNVAEYAKNSMSNLGLGLTAYLAGLLHDCGKCTEEFQTYLKSEDTNTRGSVIHSFAGVYYLLTRFHSKQISEFSWADLTSEIISVAIGSHHGLFDVIDDNCGNGFAHRLRKQPDYEKRAINGFNAECATHEEIKELFENAQKEIEKFTLRFSSSENCKFCLSLLSRLLISALIDADRLDTALFMGASSYVNTNSHSDIWKCCKKNIEKYISGLPNVTAIQQARAIFSNLCHEFSGKKCGVYRLNLPTGGGKTVSGLRYAVEHSYKHMKKHVFYVSPLLSIIDQNERVIRDAVGNDDIILAHHSNVIREGFSDEELGKINFLQETWDSPIIITTLVQVLDTMFSGKTSCIRRFNALCNSVIIFDEVQSIPEKTLNMFSLAVNFLSDYCNTTVVLCSATQPAFEELSKKMHISDEKIIPNEILDKYRELFHRTDLKYEGNQTIKEISELALKILNNVNSLLIVCNTKKEASDLFDMLKSENFEIFHLSAGMCMAHRKAVLNKITSSLSEGRKLVCVSTQLIEAGIDISFDSVIRISAGLDNIVQSAGRCNRNGEKKSPSIVHIVTLSDENLGNLSDIKRAQDAFNCLYLEFDRNPDSFDNNLASDKAITFYYKRLFNTDDCSNLHDYPIDNTTTILSLLSDNVNYRNDLEDNQNYLLTQSFKLAGQKFKVFDNETVSLLVPFEEGKTLISELYGERAKYEIKYQMKLLHSAKEYTVTVFKDYFMKLEKAGAIYDICIGNNIELPILNDQFYDIQKGISAKEVNVIIFTI